MKSVIKANKLTAKDKRKTSIKAMPDKFPFWARLKIEKHRTTLVIDKTKIEDKKKKQIVEGYVHREATHTYKKDYEKISPNPDKTDNRDMYLKRPSKHPKRLFKAHNKQLKMPSHLKEKYSKNNKA